MTLWGSDSVASPDEALVRFTAGEDPELDRTLVSHDCLGSWAHAKGLLAGGWLKADEFDKLTDALRVIEQQARDGRITITPADEDGHTVIERMLTEKLGELGGRIHTGRSRNDQVIAAVRLWTRDALLGLVRHVSDAIEEALRLGDAHHEDPMPGYTHTREAMPSTVGQIFYATAESLVNDLNVVLAALRWSNRCPLGSASGYGVPLEIPRKDIAEALGQELDGNTLFVQNSRGRFESTVLFAALGVGQSLARLADDLVWGSSEGFGFFGLPEALTTGSSIMPQKRNPDALELIRAVPSELLGAVNTCVSNTFGLSSGYHRDLQVTKGPLLRGVLRATDAATLMTTCLQGLVIDAEACKKALHASLFVTDEVYARVAKGKAFRDAYREVKENPPTKPKAFVARPNMGGPGQRQSDFIRARWRDVSHNLAEVQSFAERAWERFNRAS